MFYYFYFFQDNNNNNNNNNNNIYLSIDGLRSQFGTHNKLSFKNPIKSKLKIKSF